jgi:hypothetical protein
LLIRFCVFLKNSRETLYTQQGFLCLSPLGLCLLSIPKELHYKTSGKREDKEIGNCSQEGTCNVL